MVILEPDARVRAVTTQGQAAGTFVGELSRNLFLFKSFSLTMAATHIARTLNQDSTAAMIRLGIPFLLMSTFAGAAAMQARAILAGRDPRDMSDPKFWSAAFAQGGGLGIYGDMVSTAFTRTGQSPLAVIAGPVGGAIEDVTRLTSGQVRRAFEGQDTRLAADRLIFDRIQSLIDPDYQQSFRRLEQRAQKDFGQRFWFGPGDTYPERAPDLGAVWQ